MKIFFFFKEYRYNQTFDGPHWLPTFFKISSFVFSRRNSYRFGTTWGWIHFDRFFSFWV